MAVSDYDVTPGNNASISGIDISEGCNPGNINNAQRQMMADLAQFRLDLATTYQGLNGNLTSLSGLTLAADQGLYSTAANTLALYTITAAGRTWAGLADQAAQRTALGLDALAYLATVDTAQIADGAVTGAKLAASGAIFDPAAEWQDETGSRTHSTAYTNSTSYMIQVFIAGSNGSTGRFVEVSSTGAFAGEEVEVGVVGGGNTGPNHINVPPGHAIRVNGSTSIGNWSELKGV